MDTQAARLLAWGFALPADTPPVGTLVDQAPTAPEAAATAPDRQAAPAPGDETRHRGYALATIGGGAVLGALLSWLVARRRPPGRHTRASADARLPD
jgi:D-alanyl-D-alanine carboxypeptidase (penicillin-binding protein 5/6)